MVRALFGKPKNGYQKRCLKTDLKSDLASNMRAIFACSHQRKPIQQLQMDARQNCYT
jgi:hypothetical protein